MATPNHGNELKGAQLTGTALSLLSLAIPLVGVGSPLGQELLSSMQRIAKKLPPGVTTQTGEKNSLEQLMQRQQQVGPQIAMMRQAAMTHPAPVAPPMAPGAASPQ